MEFWLRNVLLLLTGLFGTLELFQMIDDGFDYLSDPFNYVNLLSAGLNTFICVNYGYQFMWVDETWLSLLCAFSVLVLWFNALQWMKFFESTAHFVRMISTIIVDIKYFLYI